jgi:hypothetical protein
LAEGYCYTADDMSAFEMNANCGRMMKVLRINTEASGVFKGLNSKLNYLQNGLKTAIV